MQSLDFFRCRIDSMIDLCDPLDLPPIARLGLEFNFAPASGPVSPHEIPGLVFHPINLMDAQLTAAFWPLVFG